MLYWLLLLAPESDAGSGALACRMRPAPPERGPRGNRIDAAIQPERRDALQVSAEVGAALAYEMLRAEKLVQDQFDIRFHTHEVPNAVLGESAHLLFALATATQLYRPAESAYPPALAATGTLNDKGRVGPIKGVAEKLQAALGALPAKAVLFYPKCCQEEVEALPRLAAAAAAQEIRLLPVETLAEAARALGIPVTQVWLDEPFLGLEPFGLQHQAIFFGRGAETHELRNRLLAAEAAGRPGALVIGPSGSGKSSLVQAGLLASLLVGPDALTDKPLAWSIWRPRDVLGRDEEALCRSILNSWKILLGSPLPDAEHLDELATEAAFDRAGAVRTLWVIDQFEEIFTLGFDEPTIASFAILVARLQAGGVWVVATMRSEFYVNYAESKDLVDTFAELGIYNLQAIRAEALAEVIREPARRAGLVFETRNGVDLAGQLLADVGTNRDSLPLLEYGLSELYEKRDPASGGLTFAAYDSWGDQGLRAVIASAADRAYATVSPAAQATLPALLRALVRVSSAGEVETAVPANLSRWPAGAPIRALIKALADARLLTSDGGQEGQQEIRLAHESVRNSWSRARGLLDHDRLELLLRDRLFGQFDAWRKEPTDERLLAASGDIDDARKLVALRRDELLDLPHFVDYLERSIKAADAGARRKVVVVSTAFVVLLVGAGVVIASVVRASHADMRRVESDSRYTNASSELQHKNAELSAAALQKELDAARLKDASKTLEIARLQASNDQKTIEAERLKSAVERKDREILESRTSFMDAYGFERTPEGQANPAKARQGYRKAMTLGSMPAKINFAISALNDPAASADHREAVRLLQDAASLKIAIAQNALANAYQRGIGVPVDVPKAVDLYQAAASQGIAFANYRLGALHYDGTSVAKDYAKAMGYMKKAARSGWSEAEFGVGAIYGQGGYGIERDLSKSYIWYSLSALSGEPTAPKYRDDAKKLLTSQQVDQANAMVLTCKESHEVNCE